MSLKKKCDFPKGSNVLSAADRKSWGGGGAWKRKLAGDWGGDVITKFHCIFKYRSPVFITKKGQLCQQHVSCK